jgi:hypothetical protein
MKLLYSMRQLRIFFVLAGCILILSGCSKDDPEPVATFSFSVNNGPVQEWNGPGGGTTVCALCGPSLIQRPTYFTLSSSAPDDFSRSLILTFSSLKVNLTTYTATIGQGPEIDPYYAPHVLYMDPLRGASTEEGDFAAVTFTRAHGGMYYDGTFRARLTAAPYGPEAEKLEIEGEFRNVRHFSE